MPIRTLAILTLGLAALPSRAHASAYDLLRTASSTQGKKAYSAKMTARSSIPGQTDSTSLTIRFRPPNSYVKEYFSASGQLQKTIVCDGQTEWIYSPANNTVWRGEASRVQLRRSLNAAEWRLLETNYDVRLTGEEQVSGRRASIVSVTPRSAGKPRRMLWIDAAESVILRSKEFNPDGTVAYESDCAEIRFGESFPDATFKPSLPPGAELKDHKFRPDFMSIADLQSFGGQVTAVRKKLPLGFEMASADVLNVNGKEAYHLRYTDGLLVISLFESPHPISDSSDISRTRVSDPTLGSIRFSKAGKIVSWESNGRHFALIGNMALDQIRQVREALK